MACGSAAPAASADLQTRVTQKPSKHETPTGVWMYMPHPPPHPGLSTPSSQSSRSSAREERPRQRPRRRKKHNGPPPPEDGPPDEEQAESERMTHDPSVEPSLRDGEQGQPGQYDERPGDVAPLRNNRPGQARPRNSGEQVLELLRRLARQDGHSDNQSWSSMKGPSPGVKFRGGAPPAAPVWRYQSNDVRAYEKYERKVRMWQLQIKQYMSSSEAGLALYSSLQGEAEQQLEFADLEKIFNKDGVDYILEQLKNAFQQKTVYVKRHHLHEYENMGRYPQESIRAYCNRYKRVEAALKAIGVDISLTYDAEARGSRLLDRARLSIEQQRMILVGTNGQLDFTTVAAAMIMQYPDYKPAPPVFTKDGKGNHKGHSSSSSSASTTASSSSTAPSNFAPRRKGDGKYSDKSRRVFQTINEEEEADHNQEEDGDEAGDEEEADGDPDHAEEEEEEADPDNNEFEELAQVLTVTAKKLASITQGRKFKNAPKKSIEQRKKETTCVACGVKGHWAGDPEREVSGGSSFSKETKTGNSTGASSSRAPRPKSGNFEKNKKVFTVRHYTGFDHEEEPEYESQQHDTTHLCQVVFQAEDIPHITMRNVHESLGYMTIDTACQRSCCGWVWHDAHVEVLKNGVTANPIYKNQKERFQFGAGDLQISNTLVLLPSALGEMCCYLGASLLQANIPFLCSLRALDKLGLILDLPKRRAVFRAVNREVPLLYINGHRAVPIMDFPNKDVVDSQLQEIVDHGLHDPEVNVLPSEFSVKVEFRETTSDPPHGKTIPESIAAGMARAGDPCDSPFQGLVDSSSSREEHGHHHGRELLQGNRGRKQFEADDRRSADNKEAESKGNKSIKFGQSTNGKTNECTESHTPNTDMSTSGVQEVRQRMGPLRSMRGVSGKMDMGGWRMEIGWFFLQVAATAALTLDASGWTAGDPIAVPQSSTSLASSPSKDEIKGTINDLLGSRTWSTDSRGTAGVRHGDGQRLRGRKRITGNILKNVKVLEYEVNVNNHLPIAKDTKNKVDIFEIFSGTAKPTMMASRFGLNALQPIDRDIGYDLLCPKTRKMVEHGQREFQPLLMLFGFPCRFWNLLNENANYHYRLPELYDLRDEERPVLEWTVQRCQQQAKQGDLYLLENPIRSRIWEEPSVQQLQKNPDNKVVVLDAGAFGAMDRHGYPIIKTFKIYTSSEVARELDRRLSPEERKQCRPLEGQRVTDSQEYPDEMVRSLLRGLRREARARNCARFERVHSVFYAQPSDDQDAWREVLELVKRTFGSTTTRSTNLKTGTDLYKKIERLLPWELHRIQIASRPLLRRVPMDIGFTHRGAAVLYNDETIELESARSGHD